MHKHPSRWSEYVCLHSDLYATVCSSCVHNSPNDHMPINKKLWHRDWNVTCLPKKGIKCRYPTDTNSEQKKPDASKQVQHFFFFLINMKFWKNQICHIVRNAWPGVKERDELGWGQRTLGMSTCQGSPNYRVLLNASWQCSLKQRGNYGIFKRHNFFFNQETCNKIRGKWLHMGVLRCKKKWRTTEDINVLVNVSTNSVK